MIAKKAIISEGPARMQFGEMREFTRKYRFVLLTLLAVLVAYEVNDYYRGEHSNPTHIAFRFKSGTWGYFVLPVSDKLPRGGRIFVDNPTSGIGPAIPDNSYIFDSIAFDDGRTIYSAYNDQRDHPPQVSDDLVILDWPQQTDSRGSLFFLGTRRQFQATFKMDPPLGMKPMQN